MEAPILKAAVFHIHNFTSVINKLPSILILPKLLTISCRTAAPEVGSIPPNTQESL